MERPDVRKGQWIKFGTSRIDGYVFDVFSDGTLGVGYHQNKMKAIKTDVIWNGEHWDFKYSGPDGSYLRRHEEAIVKRGPYDAATGHNTANHQVSTSAASLR
ncbi:MAG: hypothetical protein AB3N28_15995 [Kordiimonas sp.]